MDLASGPWAHVAWYFPETREQYRILGKVTVVTKSTADEKLARARVSAWKCMSDPGRQQFTWPTPGLPRGLPLGPGTEEEGGGEKQEFSAAAPSKDDPVADPFCLCCIHVEEVDHLDLKKNERWRYVAVTSGGEGDISWIEENVNP